MKRIATATLTLALLVPALTAPAMPAPPPLIQMAILLDTSNSMDGLIDQARATLWRIVNELATARRDGAVPRLAVALYEYGNSGLPAARGYIRQVVPLSTDLDRISEELFRLRTNGGDEFCGMVIRQAARELAWSDRADDLKVIFIAGNEPFTQGGVKYEEAAKEAISRGIVVNTIFCGDLQEGISTSWKDGADRAEGTYFAIDQNRRPVQVATPQDDELIRLSQELNSTYVSYGAAGAVAKERQAAQDHNAAVAGAPVMAERVAAKASAQYRNEGWDLVDAKKEGKVSVSELKEEELPAEMRALKPAEREVYVEQKAKQRAGIQERIARLNAERQQYVAEQMKQQAGGETLDAAVIQAVRGQASQRRFSFAR